MIQLTSYDGIAAILKALRPQAERKNVHLSRAVGLVSGPELVMWNKVMLAFGEKLSPDQRVDFYRRCGYDFS